MHWTLLVLFLLGILESAISLPLLAVTCTDHNMSSDNNCSWLITMLNVVKYHFVWEESLLSTLLAFINHTITRGSFSKHTNTQIYNYVLFILKSFIFPRLLKSKRFQYPFPIFYQYANCYLEWQISKQLFYKVILQLTLISLGRGEWGPQFFLFFL